MLRKYRGGITSTAKHAMVDAATLHRKMKLHELPARASSRSTLKA